MSTLITFSTVVVVLHTYSLSNLIFWWYICTNSNYLLNVKLKRFNTTDWILMQKTHENKNIQNFTTYLLLLKSSICKLCQFQLTSPTIS